MQKIVIRNNGQSAYDYGMLLLKSIQILGNGISGAEGGGVAVTF